MSHSTERLRLAVIGCGVIGQTHAAAIAANMPAGKLVVAVDHDALRARTLADRWGVEPATSVDAVLSRPDLDAVAVCTPSGTHADIAIAALEAGKHVIVEKPLDVSLPAALRIMDAARRTGLTATVISQHRFDAASELVHRAVAAGEFGRLTSGMASLAWWRSQSYYDSGGWRGTWALDGGGALMNQGIHTLDLLIWMLGEPVAVFAWAGRTAHERIEVEDVATATIRFRNGALGSLHVTTAAYPGISARLQIHGDRGSAVIDNDRLEFYHVADGADMGSDYGTAGSGNQAEVMLPSQAGPAAAASDPASLSNSHALQYGDFVTSIVEGHAPRVRLEDALQTLAVICGIYKSAETGRPVLLDLAAPSRDAISAR